mgnify:CR=1 FL=1
MLRARQSIEMGDTYKAYIIDWRLPDMNGIEVTRQIRSLNDDTPIIILTAYDWSDIEAEAKSAGVTAFCPQADVPVGPARLPDDRHRAEAGGAAGRIAQGTHRLCGQDTSCLPRITS